MTHAGNDGLEKIIRECIRKDEKFQRMLYERYFGYALSVAMLYNRDRNNAIEVVDDSFVKVFSEIRKFDITQSFKTWLRKIVINTSIDRFRRDKKKYQFINNETYQIPDLTTNMISQLTVQDILRLLDQLPEIQKITFVLYEIEGFRHNEIAEKLNISESTARVYLARTKRKLRELFHIYFKTHHEKFGS